MSRIWTEVLGDSPLVATAVHAGHAMREELLPLSGLTAAQRLQEEDPFTDRWTEVAATRIVATHSRFQVDLNRPPEQCVYLSPEDAWGLQVWKQPPPEEAVRRSRAEYAAFYSNLEQILAGLERTHGRFVVLDLHSYNHRRAGPDGPPASEAENPEVNIGTGSLDRTHWGAVVDRFMADLGGGPFSMDPTRRLDVRENVKFQGGGMSRWIHQRFPQSGCALAVEFKKFFMDEWTGEPDHALVAAITESLRGAVPGILEELRCL